MTIDTLIAELRAGLEGTTDYEITKDGDVYSLTNWRGYGRRKLSVSPNSHGYASVCLFVDGVRVHRLIHSLVAEKFLPPRPSPESQICHRDGDRMNPRADNLYWGTAKDNARDRDIHGNTVRGTKSPRAKLTSQQVGEIRLRYAAGEKQRDLADAYSSNQKTIHRIVTGKAYVND